MRKILLGVIGLILIASTCFAAKDYEVTEVKGLKMGVYFNYGDGSAGLDDIVYYPIVVKIYATATGDKLSIQLEDTLPIGTPQDVPFTDKELYDEIKSKLGNMIADKVKAVYLNGINVDISQ